MKKILLTITALFVVALATNAQDTIRNKKDGNYYFSIIKDLDATAVQNQSRTGTCWSFSSLSFIESELMRTGKGEHNLSEMFIVRMAYLEKAINYVRMHGNFNFSAGGAFHDIPHVIAHYGIVPEEVYEGLEYGEDAHNHAEMDAVLKSMVEAIVKNPQKKLTPVWKDAINGVLDTYLGKVPEEFEYKGRKEVLRSNEGKGREVKSDVI